MSLNKLFITLFASTLIATPLYAGNDKEHRHNKQSQATKHSSSQGLPPGLQMKTQRGQPLPPGWQKKLSPGAILDDSIYARGEIVVPLGKDGSISIKVEGTILKLHEKTLKIIDILN